MQIPIRQLESERLILRSFRTSDLDPFLSYRSDPKVARYQLWEPFTRDNALDFIHKYKSAKSFMPGEWFGIGIELKETGQPMFIDFTAAWCLSCQVNERVTFSSSEVQDKFKELGITAIKADWTKRDDEITKALASYGRNSVPLYVYYPAGENSEALLLPELITPGIVLDAFENSGSKNLSRN